MPDYTLRIRRYNPESGDAAYWEDHAVEMKSHSSVLDGDPQGEGQGGRLDRDPLLVPGGDLWLVRSADQRQARTRLQHPPRGSCGARARRGLESGIRVRFNYWSALTDVTSLKDGKLRLQVLISELEHGGYESAASCLADDLDALIVHLRYPLRHRERWRSTNLLERFLGEVRRRTKVMGRFPGETSCLSLVWAVLDLFFSHASNGATFTDMDR